MSRLTEQPRGFRITVTDSDGTLYGLRIAETNGRPANTHAVATVRPIELARLGDTIQQALRASKLPVTSIGPARRRPVDVQETPGVRLTLTALAVGPIRRRSRLRQIIDGIAAMSDEEAYYWYAKVMHPVTGKRSLRALRLLVSDDAL